MTTTSDKCMLRTRYKLRNPRGMLDQLTKYVPLWQKDYKQFWWCYQTGIARLLTSIGYRGLHRENTDTNTERQPDLLYIAVPRNHSFSKGLYKVQEGSSHPMILQVGQPEAVEENKELKKNSHFRKRSIPSIDNGEQIKNIIEEDITEAIGSNSRTLPRNSRSCRKKCLK